MSKLSKIGRLFTIKTRTEAWLVTYAIAVGAVERARHYIELYPGTMEIAGAKLLDSVRPVPATVKAGIHAPPVQRRQPLPIRNRPRARPMRSGSRSPLSLRRD